MNSLTDLEICEAVAKIAGEKIAGIGDKNVYVKCQPSLVGNVQYDPVNDKELCYELILEFNVNISSHPPTTKL